ncbi:MAG: sulfotransferase family protein [Candidatus Woesearchaeota archaeon]
MGKQSQKKRKPYMRILCSQLLEIIPKFFRFWYQYIFKKGSKPDFLVIGAPRSGTTSLWKHLAQHPKIEFAPHFFRIRLTFSKKPILIQTKEVYFFDRYFSKGLRWYESLFSQKSTVKGEVTPIYYKYEETLKRIKSSYPHIKLILVLRHPVKRVISAQKFHTMQYEQQFSRKHLLDEHVYAGLYDYHVTNIFSYFSQNNVLILNYDDLHEKSQETYDEIFQFLGLPSHKMRITPGVNNSWHAQKKFTHLEKQLEPIFDPHIKRLWKILGKKFSKWER